MKVSLLTLGCKVNQVESEYLKEEFRGRGYEVLDSINVPADIYVVNTCTVTHVSDRKSRSLLRRLIRANPEAMVVATGCLAQVGAEQLAQIENIGLVVDNRNKKRLVDLVTEKVARDGIGGTAVNSGKEKEDSAQPVIGRDNKARQRAFIKIQEGCQNFCSYCIVPYARGPVRSKPAREILREIAGLSRSGYGEVVLTGINIGAYGGDLTDWDLTKLLSFLLKEMPPGMRLRLSSLEPMEVKNEILELMRQNKRFCRHLHIPLQSGSDTILKAMNRRYTRKFYSGLVEKIVRAIPGIAVCSDVMVGFPGETEGDYQDTAHLLSDLPVSELHVFKYSPRPGTAAAGLPARVPEEIKNRRSGELILISGAKNKHFRGTQIGKDLELLVEKKIEWERYTGRSDNYLEFEFTSSADYRGHLIKARIVGHYEGNIVI
ncbi:MAG: tRNA (N(6)-L-threonylcarbamoyladenosine(37)-C(2))-methylthiotransferase MtaB [Syntrophomonadaceae bacterium]|jgi:threonylcarbamoyladenosine tRNA methylthiotransferase MtaB|nr:tRNA (N(6)-L-threonylcarbamoyladenosine(37)-C(2))-methylthiotransferase MtaB [Syntrophomonadaceae bacterium]